MVERVECNIARTRDPGPFEVLTTGLGYYNSIFLYRTIETLDPSKS